MSYQPPFPLAGYESDEHTNQPGFINHHPFITPATLDSEYSRLYDNCYVKRRQYKLLPLDYSIRKIRDLCEGRPIQVGPYLFANKPVPQCQFTFRYGPQAFYIPKLRKQNIVDNRIVNQHKLENKFQFGAPENDFYPFTFRFGAAINRIDPIKPSPMSSTKFPMKRITFDQKWSKQKKEMDLTKTSVKRKRGNEMFEYLPNKIHFLTSLATKRNFDTFKKENKAEERSGKKIRFKR